MTYQIGDRVTYWCAGMPEPEHGTITGIARIPNAYFVKYGPLPEAVLTFGNFLKPTENSDVK